MKQRSIESRNLLGAFLGGVIGILTFGHLLATVLPEALAWFCLGVGCVSGCLAGFFYDQIWVATKEASQKAVVETKTKVKVFREKLIVLSLKVLILILVVIVLAAIAFLIVKFHKPILVALKYGLMIAICGGAVILLLKGMQWMYLSFKKNVRNTIKIIVTVAYTLFCGLYIYFWGYPASKYGISLLNLAEEAETACTGFAIFFGWLFFVLLPIAGALMSLGMDETDRQRNRVFFGRWACFSRRGGVLLLFFKEFFRATRGFSGMILLVILGLIYLATAGGLLLAVAILPVTFFVWFVRGIRRVVDGNPWLCIGVTLTVTITSAILTKNYLHGVLLWVIALVTGFVAGGLTEAIRRGVNWVLNKPEVKTFVDFPIPQRLLQPCRVFGKGFYSSVGPVVRKVMPFDYI